MLAIAYPTVPNYHKDMAALALPCTGIGTGKKFCLVSATGKKTIGIAGKLHSVSYLNWQVNSVSRLLLCQAKHWPKWKRLFRACT